jgi:hypothetical protein
MAHRSGIHGRPEDDRSRLQGTWRSTEAVGRELDGAGTGAGACLGVYEPNDPHRVPRVTERPADFETVAPAPDAATLIHGGEWSPEPLRL